MNYKVIANIIGFLLVITGLFMLAGTPFSAYYGDNDISALSVSAAITIITGAALWIYSRRNNSKDLGKREGFIIVALGWISMSMFSALPFVIHGSIPSYTDAFFETMSGFTTTGASILTDIEALPHGLLFWRSMTHWLGGMGIIVLSLAIIPILGIGGMQLYSAEVPGLSKDKLTPRVQETAKRLWGIYLMLTLLLTLLLMFGGMSLFDSLCHSFGTLATGGFSTKNASLAYYDSAYIDYVVALFMFLAGTNFALHYYALHGRLAAYFKDDEFKFYLTVVLIFVAASVIYLIFKGNPSLRSIRDAVFTIISIITTTGYVTTNYEIWAPFAGTIILFLLFFGGSAGSTAGGIKMARVYLLLKNSFYELKRLIHPNAVIPVRFNEKSVPPAVIAKISAFVLLYLAIFAVGSVFISFMGLDMKSAMGAVAACLNNVGPGLGTTGPVANFGHLDDASKWVLSVLMLLGRLELFTVLIIFSPSFWKR